MNSAIAWLRWLGVGTMALIVLAWPYYGREGQSLWPFVGAFAIYNGLVALLRRTVPRLGSWRWAPWLDLPVAATLFYLDYEPGGPMFLSFFLGVATAALSWPLRAAGLYAAVACGAVLAVASTLPGWTASPLDLRQLASRLAVLFGVGVGAALLRRQLEREAEAVQVSRDEAARLEALEQARADFLGSITHDLKTPLTAAQAGLGMLETSGGARLRPEERDLLGNSRRSVQRLALLIDDLLAYNQLAAGVLRLDPAPLDLRGVVESALPTIRPLIRQKEQALVVDLPTPLPVEGDASRLEQAVVNLLANASQHTPVGARITVSGGVVGREARLTVADNGPGLASEDLAAIFQRFYRPGATDQPGSGMGLLIARNLMDLHGGRLWAESAPGQGAVFHIALPLRAEGPES